MNYYEALELTNTASAADIRHAYRRLVLLTHPDRTPDPVAHSRYLEVNAAYEVLSNPTQRAAYDNRFNERPSHVPPPASSGRARDEARRRTRAQYPRPAAAPLTVRYAAQYGLSLRLAKPVMLLALLLTASLALDYVLASQAQEKVLNAETHVYYSGNRHNRRAHVYFRHFTDRGAFDADENVPNGTSLLIKRTPIWNNATAVTDHGHLLGFRSAYSLINSTLLLILAGLSWFALRPTNNADHRLSAALLAAVLLCGVFFGMIL